MVDLQAIIGFEGIGINAWMVWILPFVGAALIPAIAKVGNRARNYAAVGFALASALSAVTLLPVALDGGQVHSQINWIPILNIHAGTLADSFSLISFWYHDKKRDFVGTPGHYAGGIQMWASPSHAGLKAFLMTKAGDIMMLSGMFLIFAYAGTFGFTELLQDQTWAAEMAKNNLLVPAAVLIFGGAIGKSAQFPLNEWLLEAMTGPTPVSALIHAATMVKAGVFLVGRIGPLFFALAAFNMAQFFEVVAWVGAITAFLLAAQALVNPEIKKVLAYSTGSQIGYMMMAIGIAGLSTQFVDGYTAGFFHLMSHAMFKASVFMAAGAILHAVGTRFMTDM